MRFPAQAEASVSTHSLACMSSRPAKRNTFQSRWSVSFGLVAPAVMKSTPASW